LLLMVLFLLGDADRLIDLFVCLDKYTIIYLHWLETMSLERSDSSGPGGLLPSYARRVPRRHRSRQTPGPL